MSIRELSPDADTAVTLARWPQLRGTIADALSARAFLIILGAVIALGAIARASYILASDFPLNDGGLFYAMARDIQLHGYRLPDITSYNNAGIPFGYSPLGFYVAALLDNITPLSLLDFFRLLPFVYSTLAIAAFALLARRLLREHFAVIAATLAFALIPRSFIWLLMGGGVTRGLGLLCALLALHEVHRLYTLRERRFVLSAAVLSACTVLAHVETAWFLAFSIVIFVVVFGGTANPDVRVESPRRQAFVYSVVLATLTALFTSPWWVTVIAMHGIGPFIHANASGGNLLSNGTLARQTLFSLLRITATSEPLFPLIGALGILGALISLRSRHLYLPVWWAAIILLDLRAYPTFTAIPVALLAGLAISRVVLPLSRAASDQPLLRLHLRDSEEPHPWFRVSRGAFIVSAALLAYTIFGVFLRSPGMAGEADLLVGLNSSERAAFAWAKTNTPPSATFLIVPHTVWESDKESEWFPVLAGRESVATVQGTEWTPGFNDHVNAFQAVRDCGNLPADCLARWSTDTGLAFTHVFIPTTAAGQCCPTLLDSLRRNPNYVVVYDGPGGTIFSHARPGAVLAAAITH